MTDTDIRDIIGQLKSWFSPEAHRERDLPGGGKWFYVRWQDIRERFDEVYPEWQCSYSAPIYLGDYCTITCTITIAGISKQGVGNADIQLLSSSGKNMARGTPVERASADAFKNSAENWGVARYLDEQTDPKQKAAFVRYMHSKGDLRAADFHHRNEGNLPQKPDRPKSQSKPFGQPTLSIAPKPGPPPSQPPKPAGTDLVTSDQRKQFWEIAQRTGYTQGGAKALVTAFGFNSSQEITVNAFNGLCAKATDPDMRDIYNDRAEKAEKAESDAVPAF